MFYIRNILPKTLLARFLLIIAIPTIVSQTLLVFLFYDRHWYNVSYYTSNLIANEIDSLMNSIENNQPSKPNIKNDYLNLSYEFLYGAKLPTKQIKLNDELEIFRNILNSKISSKKIVKLNRYGSIEVLIASELGILKILFPAKLLMNPTTYIFISWLIFLTIILLSVSMIFCKKQINSILELTSAADSFGKRSNSTNLIYKPSGAREIRKAGIAFLRMKDRIEKQASKRTQMLAMISHDLRTPLTRMKLQLELMQQGEKIEALKANVLSMEHMINAYLDFARGEGGEEFQSISISKWLHKLVATKWPSIKFLTSSYLKTFNIQIKPHSFERAISNIISNAIRYSTEINIKIDLSGSNLSIVIEDNGPGILDEEKNLVFKPFYRSDKSRGLSNSNSIGLGLAITKEIILGHYGTLMLEDSETLGGLKVKIELPII